MKNFNIAVVIFWLTFSMFVAHAQKKTEYDLYKIFKQGKCVVFNRNGTLLDEKGRKGIRLDEGAGEGIVWLKDLHFSKGTIEIDFRGKDAFQKSFVGMAFHGLNDSTYDAIYFRPFNFNATDPVRKIHAVQYISHPDFTWKKLRDERNGIFEKGVTPIPDPNDWVHARIVVDERAVKVYVGNAVIPSLTVEKLNSRTGGKVGLWVGDGSAGDYANLVIQQN